MGLKEIEFYHLFTGYVYRFQDANIRLLRRVTSEAGRASCAWAWLRLGLHHLALHEYDKAIQAFHCTLTINPNDRLVYGYLSLCIFAFSYVYSFY